MSRALPTLVTPITKLRFNRISRHFDTKDEARAYVDGVNFVNDSAIEVVGIRQRGHKFEVLMWDEDSQGDFHTRHVDSDRLVP